MKRESFHFIVQSLTSILMTCMLAAVVIGQNDPDPNSPTPVLLTETGSTRVLAKQNGMSGAAGYHSGAFQLNSFATVFVNNLKLQSGEGMGAFRIYAIDRSGHEFRFPIVDFRPSGVTKGVYAVTFRLTDEIGYWKLNAMEGDVTLYLTWRGLSSNRVKLGVGTIGGDPIEEPASRSITPGTIIERPGTPTAPGSPDYVGYRWSGDRARFMEQATFGPSPIMDLNIRRFGLKSWLNQQFDAPYPSANNPYPNHPLKPATPPTDCNGGADDIPLTCSRDTYSMYQPETWFIREALYGDAQLRHRVAWALAQVWVTSGVDIQQGRHMVEYHKVLSANAFGNYRDLMKQMTLNPTMGDYLSMVQSTRNNPNENYAREIMQLFSIGLFMLNQDGTYVCIENNPCQPGDSPMPTYDQNVVNDLTKVFTGWSFCSIQASCPNLVIGTVNYIDPMLLNAGLTNINSNRHDLTAKSLLAYPGSTTTNIAACTNCTTYPNIAVYANASMDQAIDNIFNHPNVGPFVSKIMIQHMVTSDPTSQYVSDVAAVFNNNGLGVRGDMKAVVRAILLHPEARGDVKTDPHFGKLREPVLYSTNLLRHFNVRSADGLSLSDGYLSSRSEFSGMGQVPFRAPTVFNFYPPDYVVPGTAMLGPEFAIMTTGTAIQRANFMNRFVFTAPAVAGGSTNSPAGVSLDFTDLQALAQADTSGDLLIDELNRRMLHSTMTQEMRSTLKTAITAYGSTTTTDFLNRSRQAVYLIATSSQFQVQR